MGILRVMALLWATSAFATTTPANDIYSDSLTIQRASAEAPGSLDASTGDASGANIDPQALTADISDEDQPLETVSQVANAAKPKPKKAAKK